MNRWGQVVHNSSDPDETWDGSLLNDEPYYSQAGIYVWVLSFDAVIEGEITSSRRMGSVTMVR